jgi:hypothetical protein
VSRLPRRRLAVALLTAGLVATGVATDLTAASATTRSEGSLVNYVTRLGGGACAPVTKTISGTIQGADNRFVNASINMDLQDSKGRAVDGQGCLNDPGYGVMVHVNYFLPPEGVDLATTFSDPNATPVTTWSVMVPANVVRAYIEVYPKRSSTQPKFGISDQSHYGNAMRPKLNVFMNTGPVPIVLPTNDCTQPHATGAVTGRFTIHGKPAVGVYASAFSEGAIPANPLAQGPLGMGVWQGRSGTFRIPQLASGSGKGQPYIIFGRLANGTSKRFLMYNGVTHKQFVGIQACRTTTFNLNF